MFGKIGTPEILLILVVVVVLFGAKRMPDMARSLGQSLRILKSETKALRTDDATRDPRPEDSGQASASPLSPERPTGAGSLRSHDTGREAA
ncbi:Sec-independent protein translocase subunit TatA [Streptacidiphilus sp. ASG 303]|uniref:Sec-independent protein translocase subunit TatA n=1 Tax=Streptacidiphilus sp. ASG 303 TaxID=2896847 RepID=UPI001E2FFCF7|nr:Sec-independent protein translocase subunit TatA [Streptacidiphilus sp. ASG 303]MCD0486386.1 Sec-independent protein translocase subunit TatA [Streptacidiphilus sp. ASG 303]